MSIGVILACLAAPVVITAFMLCRFPTSTDELVEPEVDRKSTRMSFENLMIFEAYPKITSEDYYDQLLLDVDNLRAFATKVKAHVKKLRLSKC